MFPLFSFLLVELRIIYRNVNAQIALRTIPNRLIAQSTYLKTAGQIEAPLGDYVILTEKFSAMNDQYNCTNCSCSWEYHMHVTNDYIQKVG